MPEPAYFATKKRRQLFWVTVSVRQRPRDQSLTFQGRSSSCAGRVMVDAGDEVAEIAGFIMSRQADFECWQLD